MFGREVLLDLVRNFVAAYGEGRSMSKLVAKYHQYWAVRKAVDCTVEAVEGDGRAGVVWHTQGSGKSLEMLFYTGKVARHPAMENPTVVVLTDRNRLDDQLFDEVFAQAKIGAPLPEAPVQAESREHLKRLLESREGRRHRVQHDPEVRNLEGRQGRRTDVPGAVGAGERRRHGR
jgi:type I restriction enzyme, R subunit